MKNRPKIVKNQCWSEKCRALRLGSRLGGVLEASWRSLRGQHSSKLASQIQGKSKKKSMQKSIKKSMPSKFQFWCNFDRFLEGNWRHVGTNIESKIDVNIERPILQKVLKKQTMFQCFFKFWGSKLAPKTQQKSIKNWSSRWIASWHRFLVDFGRFWEPSWGGKSSQERSKID